MGKWKLVWMSWPRFDGHLKRGHDSPGGGGTWASSARPRFFSTGHSFFGKSQEGGARHLYGETADDTQRDAQASDALADGTASARLTVFFRWDFLSLMRPNSFSVGA